MCCACVCVRDATCVHLRVCMSTEGSKDTFPYSKSKVSSILPVSLYRQTQQPTAKSQTADSLERALSHLSRSWVCA